MVRALPAVVVGAAHAFHFMFMMRRTARIGSSTRGTSLRSYRDYGRGETNNIVFVDSKSVTLVQEHTPRRRGVSVPIEASECTGISPRYVFDLGDSGSAPRSRGAVTAALVVGGAVGAAALGAKLLRRRSRADAGSVGEDVISKLKTEEVESFHVSEISEEAIKGNWWKNLPFVCVLTFVSFSSFTSHESSFPHFLISSFPSFSLSFRYSHWKRRHRGTWSRVRENGSR